jgi:GTP cyclohydrolase I
MGQVNKGMLEDAARLILEAIGEDIQREGLKDTPRRFAGFWSEFMGYEPGNLDVNFESTKSNQMVVVRGLRVWSLCEHHLLPFVSRVTVAYIPHERVLGLSKFARVVQKYAHRLQIQERMVDQIANELQELTGSKDVAVVAGGVHLCMVMRGVKTEGVMVCSELRGGFLTNPATRDEFMSLGALGMEGPLL